MHILFTAYEFVTEKKPCGGFGHYLANIATILSQHNHRITILILSNHNSNFEWKRNVQVINFKYEYINRGLHIEKFIDQILDTNISHYVNKSLAFRKKIEEINKYDKIDIVQHNGDHLECWHRHKKIPTVVRMSSFTPWCQHAYNPKSDINDLSWMESWNCKLFIYPLKKADAVYGPSKCVAEFINPKLSNKIRNIESPFVLEDKNLDNMLPKELMGKKYLLFFGRLCVLKGINTIIAAIYQILEENKDMYFVFAGNPEQRGFVQRVLKAAGIYKSRVILYEEIKDKDIMQAIVKNAFACVLPSRADNLPNSCIEAMGMGKVVIGSYGASFEQLIKNKKNGLLIKRDSANALINAVRYLVSLSPEMKQEMEKNAIDRIKDMNPEIIYEKVIDFYQSVINKKRKGILRLWEK